MKCAHFTCHACKDVDLDTARAEAAALRARIADYEADHRAVVAGLCSSDERNCSCVPHLRREVERLREALADIREWSKRDDFIRFDDGDIPLADYCARALHGGK